MDNIFDEYIFFEDINEYDKYMDEIEQYNQF